MRADRSTVVKALVNEVDQALREAGTPERAAQEQRYLKTDFLVHYGTTRPATLAIAKRVWRAQPDLGHDALIALVEALWAEPVLERRSAAVELLNLYAAVLVPADLALVERLLRESRTWALVDELSARVAGALVARHPALGRTLDRWARDDDFWIRRAAMLALLIPLREGGGDFARFGRYAEALLDDKQFFIRKAIGWVLRDTSRKRPDLVYEWLLPRAARCSGVTIREAVKRLTPAQRERVLAARGR